MEIKKTLYAVILNFESGAVDTLILDNMPKDAEPSEYIEGP